jgi:hypothetical protein
MRLKVLFVELDIDGGGFGLLGGFSDDSRQGARLLCQLRTR